MRSPTETAASCESEPIHIPGGIQPHGWLIAFTASGRVTHVSANVSALGGLHPGEAIGKTLAEMLPAEARSLAAGSLGLLEWARRGTGGFVRQVRITGQWCQCFAHRVGDQLILEIEPEPRPGVFGAAGMADTLQADVLDFSREAEDLGAWQDVVHLATRTARRLSGFDRVLIYRFDSAWNGCVVAEDGNGKLPSLLGRHFPASDIPAQAREMYRRNRLRLIQDAGYTPVAIVPACGPDSDSPLDLRQAVLRSVSPLHLQYMRNMGTMASMSASLIVDGQLWGLVAFHSRDPHFPTLPVRSAVDFLAHMLSGGIAARANAERAQQLLVTQAHHDRLLAAMAAASPPRPEVLADEVGDLLALTGAEGAAIVTETDCLSVGQTPDEASIRRIAAWLAAEGYPTQISAGVFVTDNLAAVWPEGARLVARASGVLAVSISELHPSFVMWFRPEVVQTLDWAGEPEHKSADAAGRIWPRDSFALWRQTVHRTALSWAPYQQEAARRLRQAIVGVVMRRAEELAGVNRELVRTNTELEAFSYSISHDLRAPFRHIVGYAELLREHLGTGYAEPGRRYLQTIVDSALSAGQLVDDLLAFSRLGRTALAYHRVNMHKLVEETQRSLELEAAGRRVAWRIGTLPPAWGDPAMLRQVLLNLLSNALKYSRGRDPAEISVFGEVVAGGHRYTVQDNGAGFDMAYAGKLFGVFQRLHLSEQYEGTGIGLALVRRIVERHSGRVEAFGEVGVGARFTFVLPEPDSRSQR